MRSLGVVVGAEGIELELQDRQRVGRRLPGEVALEGLVEALDLALGPAPFEAPAVFVAFPAAELLVRLRSTEPARRRSRRNASPLVSDRPRSARRRRTEATRLAFTAWIPVEPTEPENPSRRVIRRMVHGYL